MADESKETPQNVVVAQAFGPSQIARGGDVFTEVYSKMRDGRITKIVEIKYENGGTGTKDVKPLTSEDIEGLNFDWENHRVRTKVTPT